MENWKISYSSDREVKEDDEDEEAMYKAEYDEKHYPVIMENDADGGGYT